MCGILGLWHTDGKSLEADIVAFATELIRHRGPDDEGYLFVDVAAGKWVETLPESANLTSINLALGFRRLSILDLSPAGHQPMATADWKCWIVFNGEIYNFVELRKELELKGHVFRTGTDTEVILAAYVEWGEECLSRFNGMWAFAIWDLARQKLFCARDRFGIKPFYYVWDGKTFAFASEIKSLLSLASILPRVNEGIVYDYLTFGLVEHSAETFFAGVYQLRPAHALTVQAGQMHVSRYWDIDLRRKLDSIDDKACARNFYELFEDAVRLHLRSDVPIGTCLSGGLDSSSIVCIVNRLLMQEVMPVCSSVSDRQKTFSSCFEDPRFDERQYIRHVLDTTNAEGNFVFPSPTNLLESLPCLIWHQEQPFGSTSIYAQWCVMERVHQCGVKVVLDGQGADELLAGYHSYYDYFWHTLLRRGAWGEIAREIWAHQRLFGFKPHQLVYKLLRPFAPQMVHRLTERFRYRGLISPAYAVLTPDFARQYAYREAAPMRRTGDPFDNCLYDTFTRTSLPALLRYEDCNSMAHSVEARVPFLDYRLVEFVFALPATQKIRRACTKYVLRQAMRRVLPEPIRARADKMGFVTPERVWLAQSLNSWLHDIFISPSFKMRGYLDPDRIKASLDAHAAGWIDLSFVAWRWVNLELWMQRFIDSKVARS